VDGELTVSATFGTFVAVAGGMATSSAVPVLLTPVKTLSSFAFNSSYDLKFSGARNGFNGYCLFHNSSIASSLSKTADGLSNSDLS